MPYTAAEMHTHLEKCLSKTKLEEFSTAEKRVGRHRVKVICMIINDSEASVIILA